MKRNGRSTITDRLRTAILDEQATGTWLPGERLPSFHEFRRRLGISYASVQHAMRHLEHEGLVETVHGVGTFLGGREPLGVKLSIDLSAFPREPLEELLNAITASERLHIRLSVTHPPPQPTRRPIVEPGSVLLLTGLASDPEPAGVLLDFAQFEDYDAVMGLLQPWVGATSTVFMPLYAFSYQAAVNPRLLNRVGWRVENETFSGFGWWPDYTAQCEQAGVMPAAKAWRLDNLWSISAFLPVFFALALQEREASALDAQPLFATEAGTRWLHIVKQHHGKVAGDAAPSFYTGRAGLELRVGSWISVQRQTRFHLDDDEVRIAPYRAGGRKICNLHVAGLRACVFPGITRDEKQRVWRLVKALLAQSAQRRLAGMAGAVAVRGDVLPEAHPWNTRADYAAFFPAPGDVVILNNHFSYPALAALSTLYEQYEFFGGAEADVLRCMDAKVRGEGAWS